MGFVCQKPKKKPPPAAIVLHEAQSRTVALQNCWRITSGWIFNTWEKTNFPRILKRHVQKPQIIYLGIALQGYIAGFF